MEISYDGKWPNLCSGKLIVFINNIKYIFSDHCLTSCGECYFINNYEDTVVTEGEWVINKYPEDFLEEFKEKLLIIINEKIPPGCCGGCL